MYLDGNGDGASSSQDVVTTAGVSTVDIWIETDRNANGAAARTSVERSNLTINSYEFILNAEGGRVKFVGFVNQQPTMNLQIETTSSDTEFHTGFAGAEILPPGKYLLGSLSYQVIEGSPKLVFAATSSLDPRAHTSFGSKLRGMDEDNTLKLSSPQTLTASAESHGTVAGDWTDTGFLGQSAVTPQMAAGMAWKSADALFSARIVGSGQAGSLSLRVTTTKPGPVKVNLFDVTGRLVRSLSDGHLSARTHEFMFEGTRDSRRLSAGVYFYRVQSSEGELTGRFVIVR
jgi:hypothetical protein